MKNSEAIERCKTLIAEEKMLKEQKAILQGPKFADTVPSVQTVIKDIDNYIARIPGAIKDSIEAIEPEKPVAPAPQFTAGSVSASDAVAALALVALLNSVRFNG